MPKKCRFSMGDGKSHRYVCRLGMIICPFQRWCSFSKEYEMANTENCGDFQEKEDKKN